jgi:galactose mutarotase-like enzyme
MTGVRRHLDIDDNWTYHGLTVIRLQNQHVALDVLPARGANIFRVLDKQRDLDLLWRSPRVAPHVAAVHADFDDHWAGGWDDAFPGGRSCRNRYGDLLPYMGEVWTAPAGYQIQVGADEVALTTTVRTPITPAELTRTIALRADEQRFTLSYTLRNVGTMPFDYNWGVHPSLAIRAGMRFDIPATRGLVDEAGGDLLGRPGDEYDWPFLGKRDLRRADDIDIGAFALHYLTGLTAGWVAATDVADKRGFGLCFDHELFPVVWFCLVYGGWRGYQQALIEPWTGYPSPLDEAVAAGRARLLAPGETQSTEVVAALYDGVETVTELRPDGTVR